MKAVNIVLFFIYGLVLMELSDDPVFSSRALGTFTTFFLFGDNAMVHTPLSPSLLSVSHSSSSIFKFHTCSEPSIEQVIIRCPAGRCMAPVTQSACPSNFLAGRYHRCLLPSNDGRRHRQGILDTEVCSGETPNVI